MTLVSIFPNEGEKKEKKKKETLNFSTEIMRQVVNKRCTTKWSIEFTDRQDGLKDKGEWTDERKDTQPDLADVSSTNL